MEVVRVAVVQAVKAADAAVIPLSLRNPVVIELISILKTLVGSYWSNKCSINFLNDLIYESQLL